MVVLGVVLLFELGVLLAALVVVVVLVVVLLTVLMVELGRVLLVVLGMEDPDLLRTWIKPKVAAGVGLSELNRVGE